MLDSNHSISSLEIENLNNRCEGNEEYEEEYSDFTQFLDSFKLNKNQINDNKINHQDKDFELNCSDSLELSVEDK